MSDLPESIRAFISVNLPTSVQEVIEKLQRDLKSLAKSDAVRWAVPGQVHLTLRFLGNVAGASVLELEVALQRAAVGVAPFVLEVQGVGGFPNLDRPRVLWIGLAGKASSTDCNPSKSSQAATVSLAAPERGIHSASMSYAPQCLDVRSGPKRNEFRAPLACGFSALRLLQENVLRETGAWGEHEEREFQPHLTLGRVKDPRAKGLGELTARMKSLAEITGFQR